MVRVRVRVRFNVQIKYSNSLIFKNSLSASWLVRELSSPRLDWPRVGLSASCPVSPYRLGVMQKFKVFLCRTDFPCVTLTRLFVCSVIDFCILNTFIRPEGGNILYLSLSAVSSDISYTFCLITLVSFRALSIIFVRQFQVVRLTALFCSCPYKLHKPLCRY